MATHRAPKRYAMLADRLWDGAADVPQSGAAVVINGSTIESVVAALDLPRDIHKVRLSGCTILPGLIDAHVHYSAPMGPAFLAAGVTTIRDVGNDLEWILRQRARHAADPSAGPGIVCCGHLLDGPTASWKNMGRAHANAEALRRSIRHEVKRGVNAIKLYAGLDLELLSVGVAESRLHRKFTLAHLGNVSAEDAVKAGLQEIQHLTGCAPAWAAGAREEQDRLMDVLIEHQTIMTPTLVVWDRLGRILDRPFHFDARRRWAHPCHLDLWNRYRSRFEPSESRLHLQRAMPHLKSFLARLHERGGIIALGTDTPFPHLVPGFSVHDELAMYVDAGIKPIDALRSATLVGARVLGIESRIGRIAPGMQADLIVVSGNPLEYIEDIGCVKCSVRAGRIFLPKELLCAVRKTFARRPDDAITRDLTGYVEGR
ncbi:MAG: amidohydrolase family protein [Verrucomicrobia bacterium]|nr:amidohydrolase family protein [Verrucomicrobiota bacterium]